MRAQVAHDRALAGDERFQMRVQPPDKRVAERSSLCWHSLGQRLAEQPLPYGFRFQFPLRLQVAQPPYSVFTPIRKARLTKSPARAPTCPAIGSSSMREQK